MTDTPRQDDGAGTPVREGLPERTTPTWEVELLISGVAVFAMLQLPGWFDDRYFDLLPRLDQDWVNTAMVGYLYAKSGALILAGTFVIHLLMRSHWIALVGMDSIYPDGVLWDRLRMGTQQRDVERARTRSFADAIERADNRATSVFAVGVYLALLLIKLFLLVLLGAAAAWALGRFAPVAAWKVVLAVGGLAVVPFTLASAIDRRLGDRLAPQGWIARCLRWVFSVYGGVGFGSGASPGMMLLDSHAGASRMRLIQFCIWFTVFSVVMLGREFGQDPERLGNFGFLPRVAADSPRSLLRAHYDDQRGEQRLGSAPFVQSQVIVDPYLRLTIPIRPAVHGQALQHGCAAAGTAESRIDCLAALHPLRIDGRPIKADFDLGSDAKAQRPALVAMIDVRALANGRHELVIGEPAGMPGETPRPDRIPFWR